MPIRFLFCAVLCLSGVLLGADAAPDVAGAAKKLSEAPNYSWRMVTIDNASGGPTITQDGKIDKTGYAVLNLNSGDYYVHIVLKGQLGVVNIGEGWKNADDLADQRRAAKFLATTVSGFQPPAILAREIASKLKDLQPDEDAFAADLTGNDAVSLIGALSSSGRGSDMNNARATVKFWVQDGLITKYEVRSTGTITRSGNDAAFDRTTTVDFSDVGTTNVIVPDEAKKKLG